MLVLLLLLSAAIPLALIVFLACRKQSREEPQDSTVLYVGQVEVLPAPLLLEDGR
jgi:hypothetical protein